MKDWVKLNAIAFFAVMLATGPLSSKTAIAADCEKFASEILPLSLCFDPEQWVRAGVSSETELAPETLRQAILSQAQKTAGPENVETLDESSVKIGSQTLDRIVYRASNKEVDLTFTNYYAMFPGSGSMKIIFFSLTKDHANFEPLIERVAASFEITE